MKYAFIFSVLANVQRAGRTVLNVHIITRKKNLTPPLQLQSSSLNSLNSLNSCSSCRKWWLTRRVKSVHCWSGN